MKTLPLALVILLCSPLAMADAFTNTSNPEYNGNMQNSNAMSNVQVNNSASSYIKMGNITCPTATFTGGAATSVSNGGYGSSANSSTGMFSYNLPIDLNGTMRRCNDAQKAQVASMKFENDFLVIRNCLAASEANIILDPKVYPWAIKCEGILPKKPKSRWKFLPNSVEGGLLSAELPSLADVNFKQ